MNWQEGFVSVEIVTPTAWTGNTDIVMELEETGLAVGHGMEGVSWQLTTSPFAGVYEYVAWFKPAFVPLTFHW